MSLRQREYVLESLEQRVLLSADGLVPTVAPHRELPGYSPADIILLDEHNGATQPASHDSSADSLVDTTAPAVNDTQTSDAAPATTETANETPTAAPVTVPSDPDVPSAADLLVTSLHSGNGPPASGANYSVGGSGTANDFDPPFGGFNFTPDALGSDPAGEKADLLALFSTGTGTAVLHGTMEKRPDAGASTYSQGHLILTGTFHFARHLDTADNTTPAVDGAGNYVFEVWFDTAVDGSLAVGGVTLTFGADKGAFLVSGKLTATAATTAASTSDNSLTTYPDAEVGGGSGTLSITDILGLAGTDETLALGHLTGGQLTINTATGLANTATNKAGMTTASNIQGLGAGISATFVGSNSLTLSGTYSIGIHGAVGVDLSGTVAFSVATIAGSQVLTFTLTSGSVSITAGSVTLTAGASGSFQIGASGFVATGTVSGLSTSIGGITFGNTSGSFSVDTTGTTPAFSVTATLDLTVTATGVNAALHGTFTFDRSVLDTESVIRLSLSGGSTTFAAGSASLGITGINGDFVINSHGFAGRASVGTVTLSPNPSGFTFTPSSLFFEINTTDTEINNLTIPGASVPLNFTGTDRKKFFRVQGTVALGLDLGGIAVSLDGTFYFEQYSADLDGPTSPDGLTGTGGVTNVVKFAAIGANASFSTGNIKLEVTGVDGGFVINDWGVAGFVDADGITATGLPSAITSLSGSHLSFGINTTGHAIQAAFGVAESGASISFDYSDSTEQDFVSIGGTINLGVSAGGASVAINGSIAFYGGTVDGNKVIKIGGEGLTASVTVGPVTASITDVDFIFVVFDAGLHTGVAGRITFQDLTFTGISNFTLTATGFSFEFNTTNMEIDEALDAGPVHQTLQFTAAADELNFFRGSGTATLAFTSGAFSTTMSGTFGFEKLTMTTGGATVVKFAFTNVNFEIAVSSAKLKILDASGFFVFGNNTGGVASYAGQLKVTDAKLEGITGLDLQVSAFTFDVNNFGEAVKTNIGSTFTLDFSDSSKWSFLSLGGIVNLTITIGGFNATLTGGFFFEKSTETINGTPTSTLKVSVSGASFSIGVGGSSLSATGINGAFVIMGDGKSAGKLTIDTVTLGISSTFHIDASTILLEFNNTGGAVSADVLKAGGGTVALRYDATQTNFLKVGGTLAVTLKVGSGFEGKLSGTFYFEQNAGNMMVAFKDVYLSVQVSTVKLEVNNLNGALIAYGDGTIAASIKVGGATIPDPSNPTGPPLSAVRLTGVNGLTFEVTDFLFEINTKATDVDVTGQFADGSAWGVKVGHNTIRVGGGLKLGLTIGSGFEAKLEGSFYFEQNPDFMVVAFKEVSMSLAVSSVKLEINNLNGAFVAYADGTMAASLTVGALTTPDPSNPTGPPLPAVRLTGVSGLTFEVTNFLFEINTKAVAGVDADSDGHDDGDVNVSGTYADGSAWAVSVGADTLRVGGALKLGLTIGGGFDAQLEGSFYFEQNPDYMVVAFKDVNLSIAVSTVKLEVNNLNGAFVAYDDGTLAASLSVGALTNPDGSPAVKLSGISGLTFEVTNFLFEINTKAVAGVDADSDGHDDGDVNLDGTFADGSAWGVHVGADTIRVGGALKLNVKIGSAFEANLEGAIYFEQNPDFMVVAFKDVNLSIAVSTVKLEVNNLNGAFVVYDDGTLAASLTVGAVTNPDGSPAVKLSGINGLTFEVTNFLFEINTKAVAGVDADSDGHDDGDVNLDGTFADGSAWGVHVGADTIRVGGALKLNLKIGAAFEANLEGAFYFEQNPDYMVVAFKDVSMSIAVSTVKLEINNLNGTFVGYNDGTMAASLKVGALTIPDPANPTGPALPAVRLSGVNGLTFEVTNFLFEINTKAAGTDANSDGVDDNDVDINGTFADGSAWGVKVGADTLRVGGALKLGLSLGGFAANLEGAFYFEQNPGFMVVAFKDVSMSIGVGTSVKFEVNNLSGALVSYASGTVAVSLTIGSLTTPDPANPTGPPLPAVRLSGVPGLTFEVTTFLFQINTSTTTDVNVDGTFADGSAWGVHVNANTVKVGGGLKLGLVIGSFTGKLQADFYFAKEQIGGVDTIKVSVTNGSLLLSVGAAISIGGVNGAFVILPDGSAGKLSIDSISLTGIPSFSLEVIDLYMEFNNTGRDLTMDVPVASGPDIHLSFVNAVNQPDRHNFFLVSGSIRIKVGGTPSAPYLTIETLDLKVDTGATGTQHLFEAGLLRGTLNIAALGGAITIEAGNLAITAEGKLANLVDDPDGPGGATGSIFYVRVTFGTANAGERPGSSGFQWPSWMPIKIQEITLAWTDVGNHPDQFILVISAELGPIPGFTAVTFSGMVKNLRIDVYKLTHPGNGMPILGFDAAAIEIGGNIFGMSVTGGIVMGMIDFRADGTIIDRSDVNNLTEVASGTIFYIGLRAKVSIAGIGGAGLSIGLADIDPTAGVTIVPLEAMISVEAPIIIEPISGLTLGAFSAKIEFASTLASANYANIDNLKAVTIASATNPSLTQWEANLRAATLRLYNPVDPSHPDTSQAGATSVWSQPMIITGTATFYSSYVSRETLNGTIMVRFDTEGRVLLVGELLFGGGNLKLDSKLYMDFTNPSGGAVISFYGSLAPTVNLGPKPFEVWGVLSIIIYDGNHHQLGTPANAEAIDYDDPNHGDPALANQAGYLEISFTGGVQFTSGGVVTMRAEGTVTLEIDFHDPHVTETKLTFNASLSLVNPPGNPLGNNFADVAGTVILRTIDDAGVTKLELYGALALSFHGNALKTYGIDVRSANVFVQLNTTASDKTVTLEFFDHTTKDVTIKKQSFSLYIKGDVGFGTPTNPNLLSLKGFLVLDIDASGMTLMVQADLSIAPGGQEMLKFKVTGFMRITALGIAAKLTLERTGDFPPETSLSLAGTFTMVLNTMGTEVTYTVPDWFYDNGETPETVVIPESAPGFGGDLTVPADATAPPEAYFVIYVDGSVTALGGSFKLSGEFFVVITETEFQMTVDANLEIGPAGSPFITFTAEGFMSITSGGIAARLTLGLGATMPSDISFSGDLTLILNTTGSEVQYHVKDSAGVLQTVTIPKSAPAVGSTGTDLEVPADPAAAGASYFLVAIHGDLTALNQFTLTGDFFIIITAVKVQLQVKASLTLAGVGALNVHGFLELSSAGAAGLLSVDTTLTLPGIDVDASASFVVAFNTYDSDYTLPAAVATDFGLAQGSKLKANSIRVEIKGKVSIGTFFTLEGRFAFSQDTTTTTLEVDATLDMPIIGTLSVSGTLILYDGTTHDGAIGSLVVTLTSGNRSALSAIGLTFNATMTLKVNTTNTDTATLGVTAQVGTIAASTVELDLHGTLTLMGTFSFVGDFYFKKSGSALNIRFAATLDFAVGTFNVSGNFDSDSTGIQGNLGMSLAVAGSSTLSSLGFNLHGDFVLAFNNKPGDYTISNQLGNLAQFNGRTVSQGSMLIWVSGGITFFDTVEITGTFKLLYTPTYLELEVHADFSLGGLATLHVGGSAGIYADGIAIYFTTSLNFGLFGFSGIFDAGGDFVFALNTTASDHFTVPGRGTSAYYFHVAVNNLNLKLLSVLSMSGSVDITYSSGVFYVDVTAHMDFFGIADIDGHAYFDSNGNYSIDLAGSVHIGVHGFGIFGSISFHIDGDSSRINHLNVHFNADAELLVFSVGVHGDADYDGTTGRIMVSAGVHLDFFFFSIDIDASFVLGYIKQVTTYQAGDQFSPTTWSGGALYVNVGDTRAAYRNFNPTDTKEQVLIRQGNATNPANLGAGVQPYIEVEIFGNKKRYWNVTSVVIDAGSGDDYINVESSVTVPVTITGGSGKDYIEYNGARNDTVINGGADSDTIYGGSGNDTINGGDGDDLIYGRGGDDTIHGNNGNDVIIGGTGRDYLYGDADNDTFVWTKGDEADRTIDGGTGTNGFNLAGDNSDNVLDVIVNPTSTTNLRITMDGDQLNPVNMQTFYASLLGGADKATVGYLGGTMLTAVDFSLGYNDNAADTLTLSGGSGDDTYFLNSSVVSHHVPNGTSTDGSTTYYLDYDTNMILVSKVTSPTNATPVLSYRVDEGQYANDQIIINAGGGNDSVDAHGVVHGAAKLTLNGEGGNDHLVGSSFDDVLQGGTGSDTLTGGPGVDKFEDTSVNPGHDDDPLLFDHDEIVENMDVNYTLDAWTLTSGGTTDTVIPANFEAIRLNGGNSNNTFTITHAATVLYLNGGEGSDNYIISVTGSGFSTININDTGTGVGFSNTNYLRINGTPDVDDFLMRAGVIKVGAESDATHLEQINFDGMSTFDIYAGDGGDRFIIDETTVEGTIYGEGGADRFTVGRILDPAPVASEIKTIATTRGALSYGNRAVLTIRGGDGEDYFEGNHNQAELKLFGDDGDDLFYLRCFAQEGSGVSTVNGGLGTNTIRYVANGPVKIDGGNGFDRLVLEGTEFADDFVVTDTDIFGGGRSVSFTNLESIVILGGAGDDNIWVLGNGLPLEINGGTGNDTVHIGGQAPDYVYDAPPYIVNQPSYTVSTPIYWGGFSFSYTQAAHYEFNGTFPFFHWIPEVTFTITIPQIIIGYTTTTIDPPPVTVDPLPVTYRFANVTTFNGVVNGVETYNWAGPRDDVHYTSVADDPNNPLRTPGRLPDSAKNLGTINAPVKVIGDDGDDTMVVHLDGTATGLTGSLLSTIEHRTDPGNVSVIKDPVGQLLGLGLPGSFTSQGRTFMGGILFDTLEDLILNLGSGNDSITVGTNAANRATVAGYTGSFTNYDNGTFGGVNVTVNGNGGNDTVNVRANSGTVTFNGAGGDDTLNLGSNASNASNTGGNLDGLQGAIIVDGGAGTDFVSLDDRGDTLDNVLTLTQTTIAGLGMGAGVTSYGAIESLLIGFGSGADIANIRGTVVPTTLELNAGDDSVYVSSVAAVTTANRATTTTLGGVLDDIDGNLIIHGGDGRQRLMVSDRDTPSANGTAGTPAVITNSTLTGFSTGLITYDATPAGDYGNGITVWTGSGADFVNVTSIFLRNGLRNTTSLNTGAGVDTINVSLASALNAFFAVHAGAGNDVINTVASTLGLLIFGGDGDDSITTGSGNNLVFGDEGSAGYLDGSGTLVARFGSGGVDDFTDAVIRDLSSATTLVSTGGVDTITTGAGNDLIFGGAAGDTINAGEGDNLVLGDHGNIALSGGLLTDVASSLDGGGNDIITTGAGRDLVIGGTGADNINAGAGFNFVLGDHGTLTLSANIVTNFATTASADGGIDTIVTLGGRDFILGGEAGDSIDAGEGNNAVAGDLGAFVILSPVAFTFTPGSFAIGGNDTITTGAGADTIIGGFGADTINAGDGFNVVFGDHGAVSRDVAAGAFTVTSASEATGANDSITTGSGVDVIFGGAATDTIVSGAGDDLVFGDSGTATYAAGLPVSAATTAFDTGAGDNIQAGDGADIVLGGDGADTINAGNGQNLVFGDYGSITWTGTLLVSASAAAAGAGGVDAITTGIDDDIIFGGTAGDTIHAGDGADVIFGDEGVISFTGGLAVQLIGSTATGDGIDQLYGEAGNDVILGGGLGDTIDAGAGDNTVLGDHGTILRAVNGSILATTTVTAGDLGVGGNDTITTGAGFDLVIGGAGSDTINAGAGTNVVLGDEGRIETSGFLLNLIVSDTGAYADTIITGANTDYILGGGAGDTIAAGAGTNVVLGDHGSISFAGGVLLQVTSTTSNGGNDTITAGDGYNLVVGGFGTDTITVANGVNVVFGDQGLVHVNGTTLIDATTFDPATGGRDVIIAGNGTNWIFGGDADDDITVGAGTSLVFGDQGRIDYVAATGATTATTLDADTGARDVILAGDGTNWIFGGDADDSITAGNGFAVVFGDHGSADLTGAGVLTVISSDFTSGGDDIIATGAGDDIVLGGSGSDTIDAGEGNNVVFGDHGEVIKTAAGLDWVTTLAPTQGAADTITTGAGNDVILGGAGNDTIRAGAGRNLIFGDHGSFDFVANDLRTATSSDYTLGGDDTIDSGAGDDLILGGFGADTITAGDGNNVIFGDQGTVEINSGVLIDVYTEQPAVGAADIIVSGLGDDVILGGAAADTITAGNGNNLIVGDHAELHWIVGILARAISTNFGIGANDAITAGDGDDVIIAGPDDDTIDAGDGDNIVFGDNAAITWTGGIIAEATTDLATDIGGSDDITTGSGNDLIFGGTLDDTIDAGDGDNVIFGDNGEAIFAAGIRSELNTFSPADAGNDTITSGTGNDVVLAGAGVDSVTIAGGNNLVFGDEGELTFDAGGVLVEAISIELGSGNPDNIATGSGNDLVVGGAGADTINAGDGDNIVLGDNADAIYSGGLPAFLQTLNPEFSANDHITTGAGRDLILGGQGSDTITSGDGADVILGDEGSITLGGGVIQQAVSESFADGMADVISSQGGADVILGGNGADQIDGGEGNNVITGDNAVVTFSGGVLARIEVLTPDIGAVDTIVTGAGDDVIMGGAAGDVINAGNGNNVVIGDHGTITFLGGAFATFTPTTPEIGGNDTITTGSGADRIVGGTGADWIDAGDGNNVVAGDHVIIIQDNGALTRVESVAFADGGVDLIFTGTGNDLVIGGTAGDTIHAGAGNDLVFGDHALVTGDINLALLPMAMAVHPFTFTSISTQNVGADGRSVAGDDVVFAGAGDDIVLGQQGADILFGEDGDDDLIGGHNVALGQDGADVIDGGAGYDVIAGDNASILRRGDNVSPRAHVLGGDAMFDDRGNLLDLDTPQAWPGSVPERDTVILDHAYGTDASLFGNDQLVGGAGDDVLFGELGDDQIHGDATLPVTVAADGTIDRTALRATATALFTTNFWAGDTTDGDDYIEGNGGADLIFGGLGQDDIVGGSSSLFGLTDRLQRPDGGDTIYGGNGTQADDQSPGDASANGRARDADVIMGDNANIIRLVGINGVNLGAFLTFQYNTTGTLRIVVRGFDLLDYTIPAATTDIGAADKIYGEDGDDTLHGEVGDDLMYGNGNDDNLYGGQGDDNLFGGAGDDSISHSDELKAPPPAQGSGGAAEGNGAQGTAEGTIPLDLPGNVQVILNGDGQVGVFREPTRTPTYVSGYTTNVGQPGQILNTPVGIYRQPRMATDMQGSWRVFSSGMISTGRDFAPNTPSTFDEAAGADKPADQDKDKDKDQQPVDNPATPQDESQPATPADQQQVPPAPQDGQQPPAPPANESAPADTKPAQGENPPPAPQDQAGTPPAPPPDTPPAPPTT